MRRLKDKRAATMLKLAVAISICTIAILRFEVTPTSADGVEGKLWTRDLLLTGNHVSSYTRIVLADVNNDGQDEIIASILGRRVMCITTLGQVLWTSTTGTDAGLLLACDVDGNGAMDVIGTTTSTVMKCLWGINGTTRWTKVNIRMGTAVAGDVDMDGLQEVLALNTTGSLLCFNARDGALKWATPNGFANTAPLIAGLGAANVQVLAGYANGTLACVNGTDGSIDWASQVSSTTITPAAIVDIDGDSAVDIIGNTSTTLYGLHGSNGSVIWSRSLYNANMRSFVIADLDHDQRLDMVARYYISNTNYSIQRTDLDTGDVAWTRYYWAVSMQLADINDDGFFEICLAVDEMRNIMCLGGIAALSPAGGIVWSFANCYWMSDFGDYVGDIAINDIDGDGHLEFLYFYSYYHNKNGYYNQIECYRVNGAAWQQPGPYSTPFGSVWRTNCFLDSDRDTLSDDFELTLGLNPLSNDTDGDGLSDSNEINSGTSPLDYADPGMWVPSLSDVRVDPTTGNQSTTFRFSVNFTDADDRSPTYVDVIINGSARAMHKLDPSDINYADGCTYVYDTTLDDGTHWWGISASDGRHVVASSLYSLIVANLKPIANLSASPRQVAAGVQIQFTDESFDPDGSITAWEWDFGDGSGNSSLRHPMHVYDTTGMYTVALTVVDDDGATASCRMEQYINVTLPQPPTANFTATQTVVREFDEVIFIDLSTDPDGVVVAWEWDFGDGSPNALEADPSHLYTVPGNYTITLTVWDDCGASATCQKVDFIVVLENQQPSANFTATPITVVEGGVVQFNDSSSDLDGMIIAWEWDFGDGADNETIANPAHVYVLEGLYTVTLTVFDDLGATGTVIKAGLITVVDGVPVPDFNATETDILAGDFVQFYYQGTGSAPTSYEWDFGDGSGNSTDRDPVQQFTGIGIFTVTLTVIDDDGSTATCRRVDYIRVIAGALVPDFVANETTIAEWGSVLFIYNGTGSLPASYQWDFGDGTGNSTDQDPVHLFPHDGTFTITLTVVGGDGDMRKCQKIDYVTVLDNRPTITILVNATVVYVGGSILFNCTWIGGDGPFNVTWPGASSSHSVTVPIRFLVPGNFTIRFVLVDADGDVATATVAIQVLPDSPGPPGISWSIEITITIALGGGLVVAITAVTARRVRFKKKGRNPDFD